MKSKKIIMFVLSAGILVSACAQQVHTNAVSVNNKGAAKVNNPNVERSRLVNEKIAADKANAATATKAKNNNAIASRPGVPGLAPAPAAGSRKTPPVLQTSKKAPPAIAAKGSNLQTSAQAPAPAAAHAGIYPGNKDAEQVKQQKADYAAQHPAQRNNKAKVAPQAQPRGIK